MFSEALRILDENTVNYMIDELKQEIKQVREEKEQQLEEKDREIQRLREFLGMK